jgi:hypothetical protein
MSEEKCQRDLNVLKCNESDERKSQTLPLYMLSTVGILYLYVQYFLAYFCVLIAIYVVPPKKKKNGQIGKKKKGEEKKSGKN